MIMKDFYVLTVDGDCLGPYSENKAESICKSHNDSLHPEAYTYECARVV